MKATFLLVAFAVTAPLIGADASRILLKGTSIRAEEAKASGAASATVGEMTISAEVITFDREKNTLRCEGPVVIRTSASVITAKDCAVELAPGEKKLFFLSRGEIRVGPTTEPLPKSLLPETR